MIKAQEQITPTDGNRLNVLSEARAAAEVAQPLAQERGQRIAVSGSDELVVHGESEQVRAAIDKLIENALEYSPDGAVVSVDVKPDRAGRHAVVRVIDRGTGIPLGEQQRIFERFYRGANQNEHGGRRRSGSGDRQACGVDAPRQRACMEPAWAGQHVHARCCRSTPHRQTECHLPKRR